MNMVSHAKQCLYKMHHCANGQYPGCFSSEITVRKVAIAGKLLIGGIIVQQSKILTALVQE